MNNGTTKRRKLKSPAILPRIVILAFLFMFMLFINIDSVSHLLNHGSYEKVTATVVKPTTDDFLLLIPRVELTYQYNGQQYTEKKFFIWEPFFGLSSEAGSKLDIYVNTYAPNYCLFKINFFRNIINWILLILIGAGIYNVIQKIRKYQIDKLQKKEAEE